MRVLQIHNHYQQTGGEEAVLAAEATLLRAAGCTVADWTVSNDTITGAAAAARAAWRLPLSPASRTQAIRRIAEFRPDVVHVHNFFPLLTPSVYDACRALGVPAVQTLHNFRTICAGAFLLRNGAPCEDCVTGSPYNAVLHRCYRGSLIGSAAVARMISLHRRRDTWRRKVARFIALSCFAKERFVRAGFPEARISVVPNFAPVPAPGADRTRAGALFVGRLSAEKGVGTLMRAWEGMTEPLRVAGDGPLRSSLRAPASVACLGRISPQAVAAEMDAAAILVMPSEWYEGCPMALIEALARGLPVVASRIGGIPEIVADGETGLLVPPGDAAALAAASRRLLCDAPMRQAMGEASRSAHRRRFSPEPHLAALLAVYEAAMREPEPVSGELDLAAELAS